MYRRRISFREHISERTEIPTFGRPISNRKNDLREHPAVIVLQSKTKVTSRSMRVIMKRAAAPGPITTLRSQDCSRPPERVESSIAVSRPTPADQPPAHTERHTSRSSIAKAPPTTPIVSPKNRNIGRIDDPVARVLQISFSMSLIHRIINQCFEQRAAAAQRLFLSPCTTQKAAAGHGPICKVQCNRLQT